MQVRCHFDATMLIYKHFALFLKPIHTEELHHCNCFKQKMAMSDEDTAQRSAIQVCFPSGLMPIDTFCQLKLTECYKNVSRALTYTWHGRFSDGSTDDTSRGRPILYKNCRIVKSSFD